MGKDEKSENRIQPGTRINKFLSEAGVCSRRAADAEIAAGNVKIGEKVAVPGDRVLPGETVFFHGKPVAVEDEEILLAFHKPRGIVCTALKKEKNNIIDYINYPKRIYPVGRLDKDSEGLILLTNQGDLVNRIMRAGNYHEKEYIVTVDHEITDDFLHGMQGGVYLPELNVTTRPCRIFLHESDRKVHANRVSRQESDGISYARRTPLQESGEVEPVNDMHCHQRKEMACPCSSVENAKGLKSTNKCKSDNKLKNDNKLENVNKIKSTNKDKNTAKVTNANNTFHIILTQGYNRQIRRMCEVFGYRVTRLKRVRIMNIRLGDLPVGKWRDVTAGEKEKLYELIQDSYSAPLGKMEPVDPKKGKRFQKEEKPRRRK